MTFRLVRMGLTAGCCWASALAMAETTSVFPSASGNLADTTAWGEGGIPDNAEIKTESSGTYTINSDVSFKTLHITGGSNTFTPASGKKVTLTQTSYNTSDAPDTSLKTAFRLTADASDTTQTFSGGLWDFSSGYLGIPTYASANDYPANVHLVFRDGAVVTNVGTFFLAGQHNDADGDGNVMTFTGTGTMLHVNAHKANSTALIIGSPGKYENSRGRLEFLDGARFSCNSALYFDVAANCSKPCKVDYGLVAAGEGSCLSFTQAIYMGWGWNNGNYITVSNRAAFTSTSSTINLGYGSNALPAISNRVTVADHATFDATKATITLGQTAAQAFAGHSYGNRLEVLTGSRLRSNGLKINNGTAATGAKAYDYNDRGKGVYDLGDGTHDNSAIVSNATMFLTADAFVSYGDYTYNGRLQVLDGSVFGGTRLYIGYGNTSAWNTVEMRDSAITNTYIHVGYGIASRENALFASNVVQTATEVRVGERENAYSNTAEFVDSTFPRKNIKFSVGIGTGSFGNVLTLDGVTMNTYYLGVGLGTGSRDNALAARSVTNDYDGALNLYLGANPDSCANTIAFSNVFMRATEYKVYAGYGNGACGNLHRLVDSEVVCSNFYVNVPSRNKTGASSNVVELVRTVATNDYAAVMNVGAGVGAVGNRFIARDSLLPTFSGIYFGGCDSSCLFDNTPLTITSYFNGFDYGYSSTNATVTFTGPKSVLTLGNALLPKVDSIWSWGYKSGNYRAEHATLNLDNGAELRLPQPDTQYIYIGENSTGATLRVRNAKLRCHHVGIRGDGSTFEMAGKNADVTFARSGQTYSIFSKCSNCVFRITDGAVFCPTSWNFYVNFSVNDCHDNTVSVENGGVLDLADCWYRKSDNETHVSCRDLYVTYLDPKLTNCMYGNTLNVQSDGVVTNVDTIYLAYLNDNRLVVDGGRVYCEDIFMGNTSTTSGTNNMVIVRGANSLLKVSNTANVTANVQNGFRFEVPAGGYAAAPVVCGGNLTLANGTRLEVDLSRLLEGLDAPTRMNLISASSIVLGKEVLASLKASVAEQLAAANLTGWVTLSADGTKLVLKAGPHQGTAIFLR